MKELSLHILDIVQNSIHANASKIEVSIIENEQENQITISVADNGSGMSEEQIKNTLDPFFTTKKKKTGLGIPLLKQHAELAGGKIDIQSELGTGTTLSAWFEYHNMDRQPMGDLTRTITGLIRSNPEIDFVYKHKVADKEFILNLAEIKKELDGIPVNTPSVINFLDDMITESIKEITTN